MIDFATGSLQRLLLWWVDLVCRRAGLAFAAAVLATVVAGYYVQANLAISTRTTDMLSGELQFRQDDTRINRLFPQHVDNIVVVVDGATPDQADDAADALAAALRRQPELFGDVFNPVGEAFFRRNGLLYLEVDELSDLIDRLAGAQAFLGKLWRDPSLRGLFGVLGLVVESAGDQPLPAELSIVLNAVAATVEADRAGRLDLLSWREILSGGTTAAEDRRRIIVIKPALEFGSLQPAHRAIGEIRRVAAELALDPANGVRVRLTGSAPMAEEELQTVSQGMELAGALSLALVLVLLMWGLRSPRLVTATLVALIMGLVWTAAYATAAVGRLNLISVAFAVLFIGLSVDFGIHFMLRYRETAAGGENLQALKRAAGNVGGALALSAVAAAIGFLSFLPTDYVGLAELGLIAGGGMFIALFANLTVLPAMLMLLPLRTVPVSASSSALRWINIASIRPGINVAGALVLGIAATLLVPRAQFDFDPLNLRDPSTESVATLHDLSRNSRTGPYSATILAAGLDEAKAKAARLEKLKAVKSVTTLASYLPANQEEKLQMIDSAALFLLPALRDGQSAAPPDGAARWSAIATLRPKLAHFAATAIPAGKNARAAAWRLHDALAGYADPDAAVLAGLEHRLLSLLPNRLGALRDSLSAEPVTLESLPPALRSREMAADGRARIKVYPSEDLRDRAALRRFVEAVRTVAPRATGGPVVILEAGNAVIAAFVEAAALSVGLILLLVVALLRSVRDALLIFAPLTLAALLTIAASVLLELPFNFANVIVLPLLFGLGVAAGVHYVMRERAEHGHAAMLATSTPRAVLFSALTTIGSFGSIALSSHPGTSSMGVLLTIAITLTLLCTLLVLPALMALFARKFTG